MFVLALSLSLAAAPPVAAPAAVPADSASGRFTSEESVRRYVWARWLEDGGALDDALNEYLRALALDPGNRDLMLRVSEVCAHLGQPDRSLEFARRALARAEDGRARWLEGAALFNLGRPGDALEPLRRACALDSDDVEILRTYAHVAESLDRPEGLEPVYRRLVSLDDEDGEAWFQLAALTARRGDYDAAQSALARAEELNPARPGLLFLKGWVAEGLGHNDEAIEDFRHHLEVHGSDVATRRRLVVLLAAAGRKADAYAEARRVTQAAGDDPEALQIEADLAFDAGHADEGLRALERMRKLDAADPELVARSASVLGHHDRGRDAVKLAQAWRAAHPGDPRGPMLSARVWSLAGRPDSALAAARVAVAAAPDSLEPRRLLAHLLQDAGKLHDAEREWRLLRDRQPSDPGARLDLGFCLERQDDMNGALAMGREALALAPDWAPALNFVGYELADHDRDLDEARGLIERALRQEPDNAAYQDSMGWVLYRLRQLDAARVLLERAVAGSNGDPTVREHLGDVYRELKRPDLAREQYQLILASDSANSRVRSKLRDLR